MARSFERIGYDRGAYHVALYEDGQFLRIESFPISTRTEDFDATCKQVKLARDQWLRAWMREKTMA